MKVGESMRIIFALNLAWLLMVKAAVADDIDIYLQSPAVSNSYVHLLMDLGNSDLDGGLCIYGTDCAPPFMTEAAHQHLRGLYAAGDTVTAVGLFKAVLAAVVEKPQFDAVHLSLLISNHQDNPGSPPDEGQGGGTILQGYKRLGEHRGEFIATLKSLPPLASVQAHVLQPMESYFEWIRYIRGGDVALGTNTSGNFGQDSPSPDYDGDIILNSKYLTPFTDPGACPRLYSILFSLDSVARDDDLGADIAAQLSVSPDATFEQMLAHLHHPDTDLLPTVDSIVPLQKTWVVSSRAHQGKAADYARVGGSKSPLFVDDPVALENNLTEALTAVIGVSSSFASASIAVNTQEQGSVLDQLFVPLFQASGTINWPGNLKKLKLRARAGEAVVDGGFDQIVDVQGNPAFEDSGSNRGRIRFDALTYWTDVGTLPPGDGVLIPQGADGREVARGGAGQKIDGVAGYDDGGGGAVQYFIGDTNSDAPVGAYPARQLFYEPESGSDFAPFNASVETLDAIGELLDPQAELADNETLDLIRWGRGQDVDNGKATARSWILGDILHSRPVALNYGVTAGYRKANPNIRLLLGSGDGVFHIIENTDTTGNETGREVFGFYPRELLGNIKLRRDNTLPARQMRYGVDGAPVVLKVDRNGDGTVDYTSGDEAYVYFGLRRGGHSYFALDISNPSVTPTLLWKIGRTTGGDFDELGLSFSTPVVGQVNYTGVAQDVLIFTGGYDGGWNPAYTARRGKDLDASDDASGNAIYIVNARTGALVWKAVMGATATSTNTRYEHAGLVDSIPSAVTVLKGTGGNIHRLYVGDSGGGVWRVDLPAGDGGNDDHRKDNWFITKLADLGSDAAEPGGSAANDLRFFHAPELIRTFDSRGDLDGILIQSGDRAHPNETTAENHLFYLKDRETVTGSTVVRAENDSGNPPGRYLFADLVDQTACITGTELVAVDGESVACQDQLLESGWKIRYERPGEKGLSTPLTDAGRVFATTFTPGAVGECPAQEGQGHAYVVRLGDGAAVANQQRVYDLGAGLPDSAVVVADTILVPGGGIDLYDLDGDGLRDTSKLLPSKATKLYKIYWREPGVDPL